MFEIEQDRMQWWRIARVSGRTSNRFAVRYVSFPASNMRRHRHEMKHRRVINMLHRLHRMWFGRVKTLITTRLWVPGDSLARSSQALTFRRVLNCRPSNVFFAQGNENKLRPCNRHNFCPFCWARMAALFYRRSKAAINQFRKTRDGLVLYCRVIAQEVPAPEYLFVGTVEEPDMWRAATGLKDIFESYRELCGRSHKQRQRKTVGSCWRLVVNPTEKGWTIELRELFLAKPGQRLPWATCRVARTIHNASTKLDDDGKIQDCLGRFMEYPKGLLVEYPELTATYLRASYGLRMASGTGAFRACSRGLSRLFKQEVPDGVP
jgi:hypothetical protein